MEPSIHDGNIRANCPDCGGALATFDIASREKQYGHVLITKDFYHNDRLYKGISYHLHKCAGCGRGALSTSYIGTGWRVFLADFYPRTLQTMSIPAGVPDGIVNEFREAELCRSVKAWRASSALFRSVLEKTLKANGYTTGSLQSKIDLAAKDGIITAARQKRAHDEIRTLGNEVVHDEWKEVSQEDVEMAHEYAQRIIEDFYDERPSVESVLRSAKRIT